MVSSPTNPTARLARWELALLEYDFEIIQRKGAMHHVPDALSRIPVNPDAQEGAGQEETLCEMEETDNS